MYCNFDIMSESFKINFFKNLLDYAYVEWPFSFWLIKRLLQLSIVLIIMFSMKANEK